MGGRTPKASAVRKMSVRGWPVMPGSTAFEMKVTGNAPRVFSVSASESRSRIRVSGSMATFSRMVPKRLVVEKMSGS